MNGVRSLLAVLLLLGPTTLPSAARPPGRTRGKPRKADSLNSCNADPGGLSAIREWRLVRD
jgi:hypothetical protein